MKGTWTGCPRGSLPRMAQRPLPCLSLRVSTVQRRRSPGPFGSKDPDVAFSDPETLLGWGSSRASRPQNHTPPWGSHPARWAEPPPTRTVCDTCGGQGCASHEAAGPGPRELGAGLEGSLATQHAARRALPGSLWASLRGRELGHDAGAEATSGLGLPTCSSSPTRPRRSQEAKPPLGVTGTLVLAALSEHRSTKGDGA